MKKIVYTSLALILVAFMLPGCSKNTPKDVAYNWLIAFNHADIDVAKKLSTNDTRNLLNSLQELSDKVSDSSKKELKKVSITIKDVKINGDKAVATYTESDNPTKEQSLNLVKVGDNWLVQFTKVDLMADVPHSMGDEPTGADSTGAAGAPQDTTMSAEGNRPDTSRR